MTTDWIFLKLRFTLLSPLCAGSGENDVTDADVLTDSEDKPFVPATAIAGVFRHALPPGEADDLFGYVRGDKPDRSRIEFTDGVFMSGYKLAIRDSVGLDEHKVSSGNAKFDYQVVDTGAVFESEVEIRRTVDENKDPGMTAKGMIASILRVLVGINDGSVRLGYKANRGLGKLKMEYSLRHFERPNLAEALRFEWPENAALDGKFDEAPRFYRWLTAKAKLEGAFSVREYAYQKGKADFAPLRSNGKPVIPGTSLAGALRTQTRLLLRELGRTPEKITDDLRQLWGGETDGESKKFVPSTLIVEESAVEGGHQVQLTRARIDRFTRGAVDGGLYTEVAHTGGETVLRVGVRSGPDEGWKLGLMLLALKDLGGGIVALGGQTGIGRGLFQFDVVEMEGESDLKWASNSLAALCGRVNGSGNGEEEAPNGAASACNE